jgi:phage major head subunit gpT-like protein
MALDTAKATVTLRDLTVTFDGAVRTAMANVFYPTVSTIINSTGADEKYAWLGSMPTVREWLGDRAFKELRAANFVLENKHWESSLLIKKTDIDDDRLGMYDMLMPDMGARAVQHPDKLLFDVIVGGESAECWDGQNFFDTDHAWGSSGAQDNDLTFDATTGTTPTVEEFKTAYRNAVTALLGFKDDNGQPLNQPTVGRLSDLTVLVPLGLRSMAYDATESQILSNSTNVVIDRPTIAASPFLTDATKFYVFYTGSFLKPFVFQARQPLSRQMKGMTDSETKDVKFMTEARYNIGYLAWWNAVLTTFT